MPKARDPDREFKDKVKKILFPEGKEVAWIAKRTGYDKSTLGRRKNESPEKATIMETVRIAEINDTSPDRILELFYPGMKYHNMKIQIIYGER